ncbi:MAG: PstS family phosphate ABC transporter substrate-binding protein [Actinomycetes bacterium]
MTKRDISVAALASLALTVAACGGSSSSDGGDLSGSIRVDGSSTVFPFAQTAGESFNGNSPNVKIAIGESGTGGGFEKFCAGETDISNASRPIDPEEAALCKKNGITYQQVQVANDGIAIVANPSLNVDCLTVDQLKQVWNKGSSVNSLSQLDPKLSSTPLSLYGPGTDSGTFDFFTEKVNGEKGVTREKYQASEDDNQLVKGVEGDKGGFGYFGFSYAEGAGDQLKIVAVDDGKGCVAPSKETIQNGSYAPLSRPLFMYVNEKSMSQRQVAAFLKDTVDGAVSIADTAKLVPLTDTQLTDAQSQLALAEKNAN